MNLRNWYFILSNLNPQIHFVHILELIRVFFDNYGVISKFKLLLLIIIDLYAVLSR
jgi:hypothetical protein